MVGDGRREKQTKSLGFPLFVVLFLRASQKRHKKAQRRKLFFFFWPLSSCAWPPKNTDKYSEGRVFLSAAHCSKSIFQILQIMIFLCLNLFSTESMHTFQDVRQIETDRQMIKSEKHREGKKCGPKVLTGKLGESYLLRKVFLVLEEVILKRRSQGQREVMRGKGLTFQRLSLFSLELLFSYCLP